MALSAFTAFHVLVSLAAIASGFVVVYGLLQNRYFAGPTTFFLWTTAITSITGFMFPFHGITPGQVLGVLSLIALSVAIYARRRVLADGGLRRTYVTTAVLGLYFNFFVLIVQSFEKVPALKVLAPTQKEAPFQITQLIALLLFVILGVLSAVKFRGKPVAQALSRAA
jgi:hypothetical protein